MAQYSPCSPPRSGSPSSPVIAFVAGKKKGDRSKKTIKSAPLATLPPPKKNEFSAVHGPSFRPIIESLVESSDVTWAFFHEGVDAFRRWNEGGSTEANEWMARFCESFYQICDEFGLGASLAKELGTQEIRATTEASLLFRHDSPATKIFGCCKNASSKKFFKTLNDVFFPKVEETLSLIDFEALTNPTKTPEKTEAEKTTLTAITDIVAKMSQISRQFFPNDVREISIALVNEAEKAFGKEGMRSFCVGFFFLRNIVSTLTNSAVSLAKNRSPSFQKYSVLMTKIMQKAVLGEKMDDHYEVINKGLPSLNDKLDEMVNTLVQEGEDNNEDPDTDSSVIEDDERIVNQGAMPLPGGGGPQDLKYIRQDSIDFVATFLHQNGGNIRRVLKVKKDEESDPEKNLEIVTSFQIQLERYKSQPKEPEVSSSEDSSPSGKRRFSLSKKSGSRRGSRTEETSKYVNVFGAGPSPTDSSKGGGNHPPRTSEIFGGFSENAFSPFQDGNSLGLDNSGKRKLSVPVGGSKRAQELLGQERATRGGSESTFLQKYQNGGGYAGYGQEAAGFGGFGSGGGEKIVLGEVLEDDRVRAAFLSFLSRNYMAEGLLLWLELQGLRRSADEKEWCNTFLSICEGFLLPDSPEHCHVQGCMDDIVAAYHVLKKSPSSSLACSPPTSSPSFSSQSSWADDDMESELPLTPLALQPLIFKVEKTVWGNMAASCLPLFILSFEYKAFKDGSVDTAKTAFSREKAERFFGERIEGPLLQRMLVKSPKASSSKIKIFGRNK